MKQQHTLSCWDGFLDQLWQTDITHADYLRDLLAAGQSQIAEAFRQGEPITRLVRARCEMVDAVLVHVWRQKIPDSRACLVAVGGYGRYELLPASDIDILVLHQDDPLTEIGPALEGFFAYLWDLGLEIGHSVRSPIECQRRAARDVTIMTNLMESRVLGGNPALHARMRALTSTEHIWPASDFFAAKTREQTERHARYDETAYKLEPNVKESPGGLRDIQTIAWVAKRHFATRSLEDLVGYGFLTRHEFSELHQGRLFLWRVRFALHLLTSRNENRLLFDYQVGIAHLMGYTDSENRLAVERFMQVYYRKIKRLSALSDILLQLFSEATSHATENDEAPRPINDRFQERLGFMEVTHDQVFVDTPSALLEIFHLLQKRPDLKGIRAHTLRLMRRDRHLMDENVRNSEYCKQLFIDILHHDQGVTRALRRMNRYGILGRYLPNFGRIIGRMQYDLFHTLTVDEHTLFVIRNLRRLATPGFSHEMPLASQLMQSLKKPYVLYVAALMHDIAKGRGGDHSELGAYDAREFCATHKLPSEDSDLVCWLVRQHLLMSTTAQRRDTSNVDVINEFAREVGSQRYLAHLYLLTVCDIRATNPNLWNTWKDSLFTTLYNNTSRALGRGLDDPLKRDELIAETRSAAAAILTRNGIKSSSFKSLWERLEADYFLRHTPGEVARQSIAIIAHAKSGPLITVSNATGPETALFIYCRACPELFTVTTGVLAQLGLSVLDARINTTRDGYTLDTYIIAERDGQAIQSIYRCHEVESALHRAIANPAGRSVDINQRPRRRNQHFHVPTKVQFTQACEHNRTLMEIFTADRPGLLSIIGDIFSRFGILIKTAKIATVGERAEDVFYITGPSDVAITDEGTLAKLRETVITELGSRPEDV